MLAPLFLASDLQGRVLELEAVDGAEPMSERALWAVAHAGRLAEQRFAIVPRYPLSYLGNGWKRNPSKPRGAYCMIDEILTVQEVATLLKVADKTVYTMAQRGELPAFKVRGQWRFRRADLDAWIASLTRSGSSSQGGRGD